MGDAAELLQRAARHPRRDHAHGRGGRRRDRQRRSVNAFFQPDAGTIDYGAAKAALVNLSSRSRRSSGRRASTSTASPPARSPPSCGSATTAWRRPSPRPPASTPTPRARAVVASIGGFATGRFTTPEEVATLVVLLASQRTANVTGANYVIDGGLIKTT